MLQRAEMVRRIAEEIEGYIVELGTDGRLAHLQLEEWPGWRTSDGTSCATTSPTTIPTGPTRPWLALGHRSRRAAARAPNGGVRARARPGVDLETEPAAPGYRLLSCIPRLPEAVIDQIVARYGSLQKMMRATMDDLETVDGIDAATARPSRTDWPAWPSPASSTATTDPVRITDCVAAGPG